MIDYRDPIKRGADGALTPGIWLFKLENRKFNYILLSAPLDSKSQNGASGLITHDGVIFKV